MRLLGAVPSPAFGVQPSREVEKVWNEALPTFEDEADARTFFAVMMTLWNRMARHQRGVLVKLAKPKKFRTRSDAAAAMRLRAAEIKDGFLEGFGPVDDADVPIPLRNAALGLLDMALKLEQVADSLDGDGEGPDVEAYRDAFETSTGQVEALLTAIFKTQAALRENKRR